MKWASGGSCGGLHTAPQKGSRVPKENQEPCTYEYTRVISPLVLFTLCYVRCTPQQQKSVRFFQETYHTHSVYASRARWKHHTQLACEKQFRENKKTKNDSHSGSSRGVFVLFPSLPSNITEQTNPQCY